MSPATRLLAQRSAALRALARRQAVSARPAGRISPATRRGYASVHGAAENSSDLPWLIGGGTITAVGLAFMWPRGKPKTPGAPHGHEDGHGPEPADVADHEEKGGDDKEEGDSKASAGSDEEPKEEEKPQNDAPEDKGEAEGGDVPDAEDNAAGKASQSGQNVPPPPSGDETEKKAGQEALKESGRAGDTKPATSSSSAPSKKTQAENPREDPQKGEGEAVKKGGPKK